MSLIKSHKSVPIGSTSPLKDKKRNLLKKDKKGKLKKNAIVFKDKCQFMSLILGGKFVLEWGKICP